MIKFVTLTGADDSVHPEQLADISYQYPFVEWGILVSIRQLGRPRFPSLDWLEMLAMTAVKNKMNLSLHVCGSLVRNFLQFANISFIDHIGLKTWNHFNRVQLNTHGEPHDWNNPKVIEFLKSSDKEFIFQLDGDGRNEAMAKTISQEVSNAAFLQDGSHGAGIGPSYWSVPQFKNVPFGYAGGLGPDNFEEQLKHIARAANSRSDFEKYYWVDMETKIRSNQDQQFDLVKCIEVLEIAAPLLKINSGHGFSEGGEVV